MKLWTMFSFWFRKQTRPSKGLFITLMSVIGIILVVFVALMIVAFGGKASDTSDQYVWMGQLTSSSILFKIRPQKQNVDTSVKVILSTSSSLSTIDHQVEKSVSSLKVIPVVLDGLTPNTKYYYSISLNGVKQPDLVGSFKTAPESPPSVTPAPPGNYSFSLALASCAKTGSNHEVFEAIKNSSPLFYLEMGDISYTDITQNNVNRFANMYDTLFGSLRQTMLYQNTPIAYVWDDHDFGPNNSNEKSPSKEASREAYQEYVPHYPLGAGETSTNVPIYQTFTIGRVKFIMTDLRSEKDVPTKKDDSKKSMMGETQKNWFKQEITKAANDPAIALTFWVSSVPWVEEIVVGSERWGSYSTERRELAQYIVNSGITTPRDGTFHSRFFLLSGDSHMVAFDDGTNNVFHENSTIKGFPVFQAAPLDQTPSIKGGPYTHGCSPHIGQYGTVQIEDDGVTPCVIFSAHRVQDLTVPTGGKLFEYNTCAPTKGTGQIGKCSQDWLPQNCSWCIENMATWILIMVEMFFFLVLLGISIAFIIVKCCDARKGSAETFELKDH